MQLNCGYLTIELHSINLIGQLCIIVFNGKFHSGHILQMSREQQDMQSFTDGNLQHELDLSN